MQQAIEEAKKLLSECEWWDDEQSFIESKILNQLIERLEKLPQEDGWIPVNERLPEEEGIYLIFWTVYWVDWMMFKDWRFCDWQFHAKRVTHWQPLPLPPKI